MYWLPAPGVNGFDYVNNIHEYRTAILQRETVIGVVGLGYVGLPLVVETAKSGFRTIGFDTDRRVVERIQAGDSHIQDVPSDLLRGFVTAGKVSATTDLARLSECDAIAICVPTPLSKIKDPDLSYVVSATESIAGSVRPGQLIVLESTTYPGTTRDVVLPILETSGLVVGEDFFLCFSPERVDPGNEVWHTRNTPKVIGGITNACVQVGEALYSEIFDKVVPVSSTEAAELTKVYENTFRMINIALANELARVCDRLSVDVWEVVDAAATKPFGFMKFTPGPGLGGHCIPLDPHYLAWKMRTHGFKTRLIELASDINSEMPAFVVEKLAAALNDEEKAVRGSRILVYGIAYKRDTDDLRESPALDIMRLLQERGAVVGFFDPHCPIIRDDGHTPLADLPMQSVDPSAEMLRKVDAVLVVTDHSVVDYEFLAEHAPLVLDTRGVMRRVGGAARVVGLSGSERRDTRTEACAEAVG